METHVDIIAEIGVNHNGSLDRALSMIEVAKTCGADYVKFQTFDPKQLVTRTASKAAYQSENDTQTHTQFDMLSQLTLSKESFLKIKAFCKGLDIGFLTTPFDLDSLAFCVDTLGLRTLKIGSGDLTYGPLLWQAARAVDNIILSTGMATLEEVALALGCLASGALKPHIKPTVDTLQAYRITPEAQQWIQSHVTVLHCTSSYPTPVSAVNLNAMCTLKEAFGCKIGYSDHTVTEHVPVAAVAMGARVIEKHFTLDHNLPGPDHKASLMPEAFKSMVAHIRDIERALGSGIKAPTEAEITMRSHARRSLVAAEPIAQGACFTDQNITAKRPGEGISPMNFWAVQNTRATKPYAPDELIIDYAD